MPALDLALGLQMTGRAADVLDVSPLRRLLHTVIT